MNITISNNIVVENPTTGLINWCKANLRLSNPEYAKKARMGFWVGDTPKRISLYETRGDNLILPYGAIDLIPPELLDGGEIIYDFQNNEDIEYNAKVPLRNYQEKAVNNMLIAGHGILQAPAGSGKGLLLSAKIYTPDGYKRNADLEVGDKVCNSYGGVSTVTALYDRGKQPCYKIVFTDDTSIICDSEHLWTVRNTRNQTKWHVLSTKEIFEKGVHDMGGNRQWEIPITKPIHFTARRLNLDPWLVGALLGDGYIKKKGISFSNVEADVVSRFEGKMGAGYLKHSSVRRQDWFVIDENRIACKLEDLGLLGKCSWEKFIPKEYMFNSIEVRLGVLQGLMDTDGSVEGTSYSLTSTSKRLVEDCLFIVQSLGGTGKISIRNTKYTYKGEKRHGRESYRLHFKLYDYKPFTSKKHNEKWRDRTKYVSAYRRIKEIRPVPPLHTQCISVDSQDSLFITDNCIVTHNTRCGIALFTKWQAKTLWLCHTKDLINQAKKSAEEFIDPSLTGTITEGKVNIGKGVTFATVQTMCKLDLSQYKDLWGTILVDEVHRVSGSPTRITQYQKVLNNLSARHKYGLSATVHRADGLEQCMFSLVGKVAYQVPDEAVAENIMRVGICRVGTGIEISRETLNTDGTINYAKLINYLTNNLNRNMIISANIECRPSLVLSERVTQLEILLNMLPKDMRDKAAMITGKSKKAEREKALDDMRTGKKKYLFATYQLAKEGLNIPCLERLYMASPVKDYAVVTQAIGRIARTCEGKSEPICYDFVDNIGYCVKAYKHRVRTYKKNNCYFVEDESD